MERWQHWQCCSSCSAVSWLLALLQALHRLPEGNRYRGPLSSPPFCCAMKLLWRLTAEFALLPTGHCTALDFTSPVAGLSTDKVFCWEPGSCHDILDYVGIWLVDICGNSEFPTPGKHPGYRVRAALSAVVSALGFHSGHKCRGTSGAESSSVLLVGCTHAWRSSDKGQAQKESKGLSGGALKSWEAGQAACDPAGLCSGDGGCYQDLVERHTSKSSNFLAHTCVAATDA